MNKYQWAIRIAKYFNLNYRLIVPIPSKTLKQRAMRPLRDGLNIGKARKELNAKFLSLKKSLALLSQRVKA